MFAALILSGAIAAAVPPAADRPIQTIAVDGVSATYRETPRADGTVRIDGLYTDTGVPFAYIVRNGEVRGWVGTEPVRFRLAQR
jgi:hypothetical protein